jgi:hypothetical protein
MRNEVAVAEAARRPAASFISIVESSRYVSDLEIKTEGVAYTDRAMAADMPEEPHGSAWEAGGPGN